MADKKRQGISSRPHHCTPSKMNVGSTSPSGPCCKDWMLMQEVNIGKATKNPDSILTKRNLLTS